MKRIPQMLIALAAMLLLPAVPAKAYWAYGHEVIARIAWHNMNARSRATVTSLLADAPLLNTPQCPVRSIGEASNWTECLKTLGPAYSHVYPWHYQNVEICRPFDLAEACRDGNCVSAQIDRFATILRDRRAARRDRVEALMMLLHFVGDLHQPLHAGSKADAGGSRLPADYGALPHGAMNLHIISDGPLPERALSTPPSLIRAYSAAERAADAGGTTRDWSRENWMLAGQFYAVLLGGDGCGPAPEQTPQLDEAKIAILVPIVRQQAVRGGLRLARLLDQILG